MKRPEGCRMLHIAKQTDAQGVISFATPKRILGLENIEYSYGYAEAQAYSDNIMDTNKRKAAFADITIQLAELPTALEAEMMGKTYEAGRKYTSTNDQAPKFAALWEQTNSDGSSTYICFYNVTLSKEGGTNSTVGESIEFDSINLVGKAIPLSNGDLDLMLESDDDTVKPEDITSFFKKVLLRGDGSTLIVDPLAKEHGTLKMTKEEGKLYNQEEKKVNKGK